MREILESWDVASAYEVQKNPSNMLIMSQPNALSSFLFFPDQVPKDGKSSQKTQHVALSYISYTYISIDDVEGLWGGLAMGENNIYYSVEWTRRGG